MADATEWLISAADDLRVIDHLIEDALLTHMIAFHAQQAAEKSLKALLELSGAEVPKSHSLLRLLSLCGNAAPDVDEDQIRSLDSLYIESRYPSDFGLLPDGKPGMMEVRQLVETARALYDFARERVQIA